MNILLDLGAIKTGGGVQLALNFVRFAGARLRPGDKVFLLVSQGSLLEQEVQGGGYAGVWSSPRSYLERAFFEYVSLQRLLRAHQIDVSFTFFGAGLPLPAGVRSVVTVAYPIICYPESPYWQHERVGKRLFNQLRNWLRRRRLRKVDIILAETEVMRSRLAKTLGFAISRIRVLPPAVSAFAEPVERAARSGPFTFVVVSDNSRHKNIWRLPDIARELRRQGHADFCFVLTVREDDMRLSFGSDALDEDILRTHFRCLGPVPPNKIMDIYRTADALLQLSDLESFSNNYMEAWRVGLPIIASDRDFARYICGDSALYVEPHDPAAAASSFALLMADAQLRDRLLRAGRQRLLALPSLSQRCERIWEEIDSAGPG